MITNIKKEDSLFDLGKLYSTLFNMEIDVWIENSIRIDYAEMCAEHFSKLSNEMIDKICERVSAYHQYMLEEWDEEFVNEINEKVPCNVRGRDILNYIEKPSLFIFPPKGDGVGYIIEGLCEWEPEHGIDIIIRNDRVLYVGSPEGADAWADDSEYECDY